MLAAHSGAHFVDLHVYRLGGQDVLHGISLSKVNYAGYLPFTYPPAAALVFTMFAGLPFPAAATLMTIASAIALAAALYFGLRLAPVSSWLGRRQAARLALAAGAAALWLEPVHTTLSYGQVNVLLAALILYDLSRPDGARLKGAGIGLAAGIKLTPGVFAVYLVCTRRYRAAAVAAAVFAATVAVAYAAAPSSSAWYWGGTFLNPSHVGSEQLTMNQSLLGLLTRSLHSTHVPAPWLILVAVIGAAGLALAARAGRAGNEAAGYSLCAVTGLLISQISWTHHWVIAVPALLLAVVTVWHRRILSRRAAGAWLAVLAGAGVTGWAALVRHVPEPTGPLHLSPLYFVLGDGYVLIGLAVLGVAACQVIVRPMASRIVVAGISSPATLTLPRYPGATSRTAWPVSAAAALPDDQLSGQQHDMARQRGIGDPVQQAGTGTLG